MFRIEWTIYPGSKDHPVLGDTHPRIGISIPPTPSISYLELCDLINQLRAAERAMRAQLVDVAVGDLK